MADGGVATDEHQLRSDLALACRILGASGQGDTIFGQVSARLPEWTARCWIKGSGVGLEEVTEDDLVLMDFEGSVLRGSRRPHHEWPLHTEIMRARPDVCAVVHTKPTYSIVFAARGLELRAINNDAAYFIPPGVPTFRDFTDLVSTQEQGRAVARTLRGSKAVFLINHGIATADASVRLATWSALMLEKAAMLQLLAQPTVEASFAHSPEHEALGKHDLWGPRAVEMYWSYWERRLARETTG